MKSKGDGNKDNDGMKEEKEEKCNKKKFFFVIGASISIGWESQFLPYLRDFIQIRMGQIQTDNFQ